MGRWARYRFVLNEESPLRSHYEFVDYGDDSAGTDRPPPMTQRPDLTGWDGTAE